MSSLLLNHAVAYGSPENSLHHVCRQDAGGPYLLYIGFSFKTSKQRRVVLDAANAL